MVTNPGFGQYSPPDVAALGEGGRLDDLGCHPGVGAGGAHLGGLVPLPGQAEVGDLQRQTLHTFILYGLSQQDWTREGREGRKTDENSQRIDHFTISLHHCKDLFHTFIACKKQKKQLMLISTHAQMTHSFLTSSSSCFYATTIQSESDKHVCKYPTHFTHIWLITINKKSPLNSRFPW